MESQSSFFILLTQILLEKDNRHAVRVPEWSSCIWMNLCSNSRYEAAELHALHSHCQLYFYALFYQTKAKQD